MQVSRIRYTVYSVDKTKARVKATTADGREVEVDDDALMVQLVPDEKEHQETGTIKLMYFSNDAPEAKELFVEGAKIVAEFSREGAD